MSKTRKTAECPNCCPDRGPVLADFEAEENRRPEVPVTAPWEERYEKVWRCTNCRYETPRRVLSREDRAEMTPSQEREVLRILTFWAGSMGDTVHEGSIQFSGRNLMWGGIRGPFSRKGALPLCDKGFLYIIGPQGKVTDAMAESEARYAAKQAAKAAEGAPSDHDT